MKAVVCFLVAVGLIGCAAPDSRRPGFPITSETVGATPLLDVESFPLTYRRSLRITREYLVRQGEKPAEFYVGGLSTEAEYIEIPLWHASAFEPENAAVGNPGGRNRTLRYDPATQAIVRALYWQ